MVAMKAIAQISIYCPHQQCKDDWILYFQGPFLCTYLVMKTVRVLKIVNLIQFSWLLWFSSPHRVATPPLPCNGSPGVLWESDSICSFIKKKSSNINSSNYAFLFYLLRFNLTWKAFKKFRKVLVSVEMRRLSSDWSIIFLVKCTSARVTSACFCSLLKAFNTEEE